jgi:hypothetical protein
MPSSYCGVFTEQSELNRVSDEVMQMTLSADPVVNQRRQDLLLGWLEEDSMRPEPQFFMTRLENNQRYVFRPLGRYRALRIGSKYGPPLHVLLAHINLHVPGFALAWGGDA